MIVLSLVWMMGTIKKTFFIDGVNVLRYGKIQVGLDGLQSSRESSGFRLSLI
ncbi:hypothetical protein Lalb_Chr02g0148351 [Lupinus albus]|uniref:Uncharacterized protein n=1 Tax=Lupinus albus TaxID=3870 RepID=A0A6A4QZ38_LUPAL|nr:hypothetical protein Lalb_Chr02g0148351 [Lupinus albus]